MRPEAVIHEVECDGGCVVLDLLAEGVRLIKSELWILADVRLAVPEGLRSLAK